jgi:hypothetical protein
MNDAIEVCVGKRLVQCCAISNIDFGEFVTLIFEVTADVVAFDVGIVEVVEVIDDGDVFDVRCEQTIDEM